MGTSSGVRIHVDQVEVGDRPVRFRWTGQGPPVVLVHGLAGTWRWWERCLPDLARRHTVYAVDLPGFGAQRGARFSLAAAPAFLAAWMDAAGVGPAAFVGHSMGGVACLRLAAAEPARVTRLVLVAPAVDLRSSLLGYAVPLARAAVTMRPTFTAMVALEAMRGGLVALGRTAAELVGDSAVDGDLAAIRTPTLIVWGTLDPIVPPATAEALRARLPGARVHLLPAGHVPMVDVPGAFASAVLAHLDGRAPPGPD
ncbi:MAG TPA: alpha/beta fold hydrolase [Miltoncostaeaceae bacterium]|nr:alpha/beta fold hydrolase [Miltoncostaeaceae bacterium]